MADVTTSAGTSLTVGVDGSISTGDPNKQGARASRITTSPSSPNAHDVRTETEKDRGRIHYSPALRRLSGVTQVITPSNVSVHRHTRESHSQKVSLVAREIAEDLARKSTSNAEIADAIEQSGGLDIAACEAAGLGHDLGHPPFGHAGEVELNRLLRESGVADGFEGNAQSFRIASRLQYSKPDRAGQGLCLTAVTLGALLKYPFPCPDTHLVGGPDAAKALVQPPKFGVYADDYAAYEFVVEKLGGATGDARVPTIEAAVMDLADDVTYAIHDLEDFYRDGAIDFVRILKDINTAQDFLEQNQINSADPSHPNAFLRFGRDVADKFPGWFHKEKYSDALEWAKTLIVKGGFETRHDGSPAKLAKVSAALSKEVGYLLKGITAGPKPPYSGAPPVWFDVDSWHRLQPLKTITRRYLVGTSRVKVIEQSQRAMIVSLYRGLENWLATGPSLDALPHPLSDFIGDVPTCVDDERCVKSELNPDHYRAISDFICTLSDAECALWTKWMMGVESPEFAPHW